MKDLDDALIEVQKKLLEQKKKVEEIIEDLPIEEADPFEEKMKEEREKMKREEKEEKEEKSEEVSEKSDEFYDWINFGSFKKIEPKLKEEISDFCKILYDFMIKQNITFNLLFNGRYEKDLPKDAIEKIDRYKGLVSSIDENKSIWSSVILPSFKKHFNDNRIKIIEEKIKECKQIIDVYNLDIQKIIKKIGRAHV